MLKTSCVCQCAFIVRDIRDGIAFYQDLFGWPLVRGPEPDWPCAWLQVGPLQQLHLIERPEPEQFLNERSVRHIALAVSDIQTATQELVERKLDAFCYDSQGNRKKLAKENMRLMGTLAVFFHDPFGNLIKLVHVPA